MYNKKCLIITYGFFGDIAFASSIAKKLKEESQFQIIDYLIGFKQMERLLQNNPYIDTVYVTSSPAVDPSYFSPVISSYDKVIKLNPLSFTSPPPLEFQEFAAVKNPDTQYQIFTEPEYDEIAQSHIKSLSENGKKTIAVMNNWESKTYLFTKKQYEDGIDVPNLGYGGKHRNIDFIIDGLSKQFNIIYVGMPDTVSQHQTFGLEDNDQKSLLFECSLMKYCDAFIGTEGGLCNLAAGVGTRTIITGDFVHQLYGWNGVIKKIKNPKLGPKYYFKNKGHVTLDPYLSDQEVVNKLFEYLVG